MNTTHQKDKGADSKFIQHEHLDKIGEIPVYYGFSAKKSPEIKKIDITNAKSLMDGDFIDDEEGHDRLPLHVEEKIALLRMYQDDAMHAMPQPVMLYFKEPFKGFGRKPGPYARYGDLEIIGNSRSIAEATLIQTARVMLREEGYENIVVEINSIGDKDSIARFNRELSNYYRKHVNDMHAECRQLLKQDPFELLMCQNEKCIEINQSAPKSMNYLTEASRIHFQEVLEYLETLGIAYRINHHLVGNRKYCAETVFSIVNADHEAKHTTPAAKKTAKAAGDHKILAIGVRYDGLAKKIGMKREVQGVGLSLLVKGTHADLRKDLKKTKKPFASYVQLGFESKLMSLDIIESLRQVKIPLHLSLAKDRLGAQVSLIEKNHIPYTIIMGKKEAMEKSVIVRDTETHRQENVMLVDLPKYMKRLEK
jgi:histidyl-tRNA synthetase